MGLKKQLGPKMSKPILVWALAEGTFLGKIEEYISTTTRNSSSLQKAPIFSLSYPRSQTLEKQLFRKLLILLY